MAVDEDGMSEEAGSPVHELAQHAVIGLVEPFDAPQGLFDRDPSAIDFLSVRDDPRDRAEPAGDPHRARVGEGREAALEHPRIELVGLPVQVEEGAREARRHQGRAEFHHRREELVHEGVLGTPQGERIETGLGEKGRRIERAGVGRIEHERHALPRRFGNEERRFELVRDGRPHQDSIGEGAEESSYCGGASIVCPLDL